jgi:hypothetical protein
MSVLWVAYATHSTILLMNYKVLQNTVTAVSFFNFVQTQDPPQQVGLRPTYNTFWGCLYHEKTEILAAGKFIILFE